METHQERDGYEVTWRYGEVQQTTRLDRRPEGDRVVLEEGRPNWDLVVAAEG
ncbi:hypothetical protein [Halomonas sp. BM-2019]|uniref:hypothetical protein n=1 Tax=Halomonas sp. BM-2019 TaxID=2811227 RepID=UPI0031FE15F0